MVLTSQDAFASIDLEARRDIVETSEVNHELLHDIGTLCEGSRTLFKSLIA